jgi:hypothetical protein
MSGFVSAQNGGKPKYVQLVEAGSEKARLVRGRGGRGVSGESSTSTKIDMMNPLNTVEHQSVYINPLSGEHFAMDQEKFTGDVDIVHKRRNEVVGRLSLAFVLVLVGMCVIGFVIRESTPTDLLQGTANVAYPIAWSTLHLLLVFFFLCRMIFEVFARCHVRNI